LGNEFPNLALLVLAPLQSPCSALVGPSELPRPPDLLSWDSSWTRCRGLRQAGSLDTRSSHPSTDIIVSVHSRRASLPGFGLRGTTSKVPFRPRGFSPPRRFPPLDDWRACCIPQPVLRFAAFPVAPTWSARSEDRARSAGVAFPATRTHTLRRTPLVHSRTASPRPLPPCRHRRRSGAPPEGPVSRIPVLRASATTARLRGLAPSTSPYLPSDRFQSDGGLSSHGLRSPPRSFGAARSTASRRQRSPGTLPKEDTKQRRAPFRSRIRSELRGRPSEDDLPSGSPRSLDHGEGAAIRARRSRHQETTMRASWSQRGEPKLALTSDRAAAPRRNVGHGRFPIRPASLRGFAEPVRSDVRDVASDRLAPPESVRSRSSRGPFRAAVARVASRGYRRRVPRRPSWGF